MADLATLRTNGFPAIETYDPFVPEFSRLPNGKFELVSCFETLEHLPDPISGIAALAGLVAEPGIVVFSTLVQPADLATQKNELVVHRPAERPCFLICQVVPSGRVEPPRLPNPIV